MNCPKLLLVVFIWISVNTSSARPAPVLQAPSLLAEAGHSVPTTPGATAKSFQISSATLKETRRIYIVLPGSFSHSAPDRKYPVTIVLDGEDNLPQAAAVSDELSRNGQIPEMVIVAIPNIDPLRGRVRDLTPPGLSVSGSSLNEGGYRFNGALKPQSVKNLIVAAGREEGGHRRTLL
jgi:enterochelin esterase-like enzyme